MKNVKWPKARLYYLNNTKIIFEFFEVETRITKEKDIYEINYWQLLVKIFKCFQ